MIMTVCEVPVMDGGQAVHKYVIEQAPVKKAGDCKLHAAYEY